MIALKHARLFGGKPEPLLRSLQGVDALEQRVVQIGFAAMAREDGSDFALDRLNLVIGRRAGEIEEDARDLVEALPAALQRLDRVGEGRRLRIAGDGVDLRPRCLSAASNAGEKWPGSMRSNGGASKGPVQASRSGFASIWEPVMRASRVSPSAMRKRCGAQPLETVPGFMFSRRAA